MKRSAGALFVALTLVLSLAAVIVSPPAKAVIGTKALVLGSSASGGAGSKEAVRAAALGYTVNVVSDPAWGAMTAADFAEYRLIIVGDPTCSFVPAVVSQNALALSDAVMARAGGNTTAGNRILIGTDPVFHYTAGSTGAGGQKLIDTGIDFAKVQPGSTGLYLDMSCLDHDWDGNLVPDVQDKLLPKLSAAPSPVWTQNQSPPCGGSVSLISNAAQFATLATAHLQGWGCSVHETFPVYPTDWFPLAVATDTTTTPTCGTDVTTGAAKCGEAYILIAGSGIVASAPNLSLTPLTATNPVGTTHTVTATVTDPADGSAKGGVTVSFLVTGANAGATGTCGPASCVSDSAGQVTFTYTGASAGSDTITAQVTVGSATQTATAAKDWVAVTNNPPTAGAGGPYSGNEGSAIALAGTAADADPGDTLTYLWAQTASTLDAGATCTIAAPTSLATSVTCDDDGIVNLDLTVSDGTASTTASTTVTVANVSPTIAITAPADGSIVPMGATVNLASTFGDAGTNDLATMVCAVDWDAGAGPAAVTPSGTSCNAANAFGAPGVYNLSMKADDVDGGSALATVMVIVYDPSAGFVTGGGWITSAPGSYVANPSLSGKATFGFVSKYKKGATVPTGQTEFQFHAGSFNFHSAAYQWLVVSGPKAQYKGTGSVNGTGGYSFLLTATDGQVTGGGGVDKLRIKVWDTVSDTVVYDNVLGASDTISSANPQAIGGGSIVIHK